MRGMILAVLGGFGLFACQAAGPEPVLTAADPNPGTLTLVELDGGPPPYAATISFPAPGRIAGQSPCNSYFGPVLQEETEFRVGLLTRTEMGCEPDLMAAEEEFMALLTGMRTMAELDGQLTLSGEGHEMVFAAITPLSP